MNWNSCHTTIQTSVILPHHLIQGSRKTWFLACCWTSTSQILLALGKSKFTVWWLAWTLARMKVTCLEGKWWLEKIWQKNQKNCGKVLFFKCFPQLKDSVVGLANTCALDGDIYNYIHVVSSIVHALNHLGQDCLILSTAVITRPLPFWIGKFCT